MRGLIQRVSRAEVRVAGERIGSIGAGVLLLVAAGHGDGPAEADWLAGKVARLRIFPDEVGRMNRSLADAGGSVLAVPQFTLYGDVSRGNRPSFTGAAAPAAGEPLIRRVASSLRALGLDVAEGRFGAHMEVELVNDGPVTIWLESPPRT